MNQPYWDFDKLISVLCLIPWKTMKHIAKILTTKKIITGIEVGNQLDLLDQKGSLND